MAVVINDHFAIHIDVFTFAALNMVRSFVSFVTATRWLDGRIANYLSVQGISFHSALNSASAWRSTFSYSAGPR